MLTPFTLTCTGHRPDKLAPHYHSPLTDKLLDRLAYDYLNTLCPREPTLIITGMALGWDQAIARAAIKYRIPFVAAIPCERQHNRWPPIAQIRYEQLLAKAHDIVNVCDGPYASWKMQRRNEWMIQRATHIVALWNATPGGTANAITYARTLSPAPPIDNLWYHWTTHIVPTYTNTTDAA